MSKVEAYLESDINLDDFDYLVDWQTVINNKRKYELLLINLNYLLGKKENFNEEFEYLFRQNPSIVEAFPILLATREIEINLIDNLQALNVNRFIFFSSLVNNLI